MTQDQIDKITAARLLMNASRANAGLPQYADNTDYIAAMISGLTGLDPRQFLFFRDALARQQMGGTPCRIATLTDSRGSAYFGGFVATTNGLRSWPVSLIKIMGRDTGLPVAYDAFWGAQRGVAGTVGTTTDSRIAATNWVQGATKGPGGSMFNCSTVGGLLQFTTSQSVDTFDVIYHGAGGGSFQVSVDGGTTPLALTQVIYNGAGVDGQRGETTSGVSATTLSCNHGASGQFGTSFIRRRVSASGAFADANFGAAGIKTFTIKCTVAGVNIIGVAAYNSSAPQIQMHQVPWVGATTASWGDRVTAPTALQFWPIIRPDLTIIDLGTNDMVNNLGQVDAAAGQALAATYLDNILGTPGVSGVRQYGDAVLVVPYDQAETVVPLAQQQSWQNFIRSYAGMRDVPVIDMQARMEAFTRHGLAFGVKGQTTGWFADGTHMTEVGQQDYAKQLARLLDFV